MKKIILVLTLLCLLGSFSIAYSAPAAKSAANNGNAANLTKIEKFIYGYDYAGESEAARLDRLEKYAYGSAAQGASATRISKLIKDLNVVEEQKVATAPEKLSPGSNMGGSPVYDYDDIGPAADSSAQYPIVDKLEQKIFSKATPNEDIYKRVSKLEKQIFKSETPNKPLNERVDKLKTAVITDVAVASYDDDGLVNIVPDYGHANPYEPFGRGSNSFGSNSQKAFNSGIYNELSILERENLNRTYPTMSVDDRLSQLESKVFQRVYNSDDEDTRVERIAAASQAQKTSQYGGSKFEKHLATGMQVAGFLLMILAFVL